MNSFFRYCAPSLAAVMIAISCGCASSGPRPGRAVAGTAVQGAATGARIKGRAAQTAGGAAVDAVRSRNP